MKQSTALLLATSWLVSLIWAFIGGADLSRWHIVSKCGDKGIWVIGDSGFGQIGGGCNILPPEVKRVLSAAEGTR